MGIPPGNPWVPEILIRGDGVASGSSRAGVARNTRYRWITDGRLLGPRTGFPKTKKPSLGVGFRLVVPRGIEPLVPL